MVRRQKVHRFEKPVPPEGNTGPQADLARRVTLKVPIGGSIAGELAGLVVRDKNGVVLWTAKDYKGLEGEMGK